MNATASTFRAAVESQDLSTGLAVLADDVVFHSPAVHRPYQHQEPTVSKRTFQPQRPSARPSGSHSTANPIRAKIPMARFWLRKAVRKRMGVQKA